MAKISLKKDVRVGIKQMVTCRECKRSTKHLILSDIRLKGVEDAVPYEFIWFDEYQIVQCQGCEAISFRKTHEDSEDYDIEEDGEEKHTLHIDIYPNPEVGRNPVADYQLLPPTLQRIYIETNKSINASQPILTGIGIRAIVETVCKDKKANGTDLFGQINDLVKQGVLTEDGAKILHKLRTLGNQAAHEAIPHDNVALGLAFDVIDHLLQGVYILPHHAKTKFK